MEKYTDYSAEQLASLESFQNWFLKRKGVDDDVLFWEAWITRNRAEKETEISEAIAMLTMIQGRDPEPDMQAALRSWENFTKKLYTEPMETPKVVSPQRHRPLWHSLLPVSIAASVLILLITLCIVPGLFPREIKHETAFGEIQSVTLPDNSTVTLNSNSTLTYDEHWDTAQERHVWLKGEAFFSVVPTASDQKFVVHTDNGLSVEVLGTEFNVTDRETRTRVVLNSGKIRLALKNEHMDQQVMMMPGELVEFKDTTIIKRIVNPAVFNSWKCKELKFDNTKLEEVVWILQENYGIEVEIPDQSLLEKMVSGSVPSNNTNLLIEGLAESFDLDIEWTRNHVKITSRH